MKLIYCTFCLLAFSGFIGFVSCVQETPPEMPDAYNNFSSETIHVGQIVSDLEVSVRFYEDVIGMKRISSFDIDEDFGARSGLSNGLPFHVEVLQLGTGETATQWKLMSFDDHSTPQDNTFIQDHTGMQYITIFVRDMSAAIDRLESHDVPMLGDTPTVLDDGDHFVLVKDPDGTFIELIGPME